MLKNHFQPSIGPTLQPFPAERDLIGWKTARYYPPKVVKFSSASSIFFLQLYSYTRILVYSYTRTYWRTCRRILPPATGLWNSILRPSTTRRSIRWSAVAVIATLLRVYSRIGYTYSYSYLGYRRIKLSTTPRFFDNFFVRKRSVHSLLNVPEFAGE